MLYRNLFHPGSFALEFAAARSFHMGWDFLHDIVVTLLNERGLCITKVMHGKKLNQIE